MSSFGPEGSDFSLEREFAAIKYLADEVTAVENAVVVAGLKVLLGEAAYYQQLHTSIIEEYVNEGMQRLELCAYGARFADEVERQLAGLPVLTTESLETATAEMCDEVIGFYEEGTSERALRHREQVPCASKMPIEDRLDRVPELPMIIIPGSDDCGP